MSGHLPVLSGEQLIKLLGKQGWIVVRQKGSHVRMKNPDNPTPLVVPVHGSTPLKLGTMAAILKDAGLSRETLTSRSPRGRSLD